MLKIVRHSELQALEMTIHAERKSKKKNRNTAVEGEHKRKLEETELEAVVETKKEKKKKKKEEKEETFNGSEEISNSKKKNKQKLGREKESWSNGLELDNDETSEKLNGSDQNCDGEVRESNEGVVVSGKDVNDSKYGALKSFSESGLPDNVLECCKTFDKPSPIQSHSWRFLLEGRDFIGIAKTGSGSSST